jgi:hypothetical protein
LYKISSFINQKKIKIMATQKPWMFTQNPFLNVTGESYRLAVRISTYHLGAISKNAGNPFFDGLIKPFAPLQTTLAAAYSNWRSQSGSQQGETLQVTQLLKLLSGTKIKKWDIAIQGVYDNSSPDYKKLLPNNRAPFQAGTQQDRITAVSSLVETIGSDAALAAVKTDANSFLADIQTAITSQKGTIAGTKTNSDAVEAARVAMCIGMYANLGALMQQNAAMPENIEPYFDLSAIRSGAQVVFTGETKPLETENIFKHTFLPGDKLLLKNEGVTELQFFLAAQKDDAPGSGVVILAAGQQTIADVSNMAKPGNTYFNVLNSDAINIGEWTVEFV